MSLAEYLRESWIKRLEEERWAPEEPRGTWASNIGHPCLFYLWATRARWQDATTPDEALMCIFDLGNHYEAYAKDRLRAAGFEILEEQRLYVNEDLNIRGRCDGRIRKADDLAPEALKRRHGVLAEIKGLNDAAWSSVNSIEDMLASSRPWMRKWPHQLAFYVHEAEDDIGLFALINKLTGQPKFIVLELEEFNEHLAVAYRRIARVNGYLTLNRQAPALTYDPLYCARCDWAHICPTAASLTGLGDAIKMSSDHLDTMLGEVDTLEENGKAYQSSRTAVKKMLDETDAWPEDGTSRVLITDTYTVELETRGGRHYWSIKTERGE